MPGQEQANAKLSADTSFWTIISALFALFISKLSPQLVEVNGNKKTFTLEIEGEKFNYSISPNEKGGTDYMPEGVDFTSMPAHKKAAIFKSMCGVALQVSPGATLEVTEGIGADDLRAALATTKAPELPLPMPPAVPMAAPMAAPLPPSTPVRPVPVIPAPPVPPTKSVLEETGRLYPENVLRTCGIANIAALPEIKINRILYQDDTDSDLPDFRPPTAKEIAPHKAIRGTDAQGRPFISYIDENSIACTLFPLHMSQKNWYRIQSMRGENVRDDIEPYSMDANMDTMPIPVSPNDLGQLSSAFASNRTPELQPNPKLVCIDFDETITAVHVHFALSQTTPTPILEEGVCVFKEGIIRDPNNPNRTFGCSTPGSQEIYQRNTKEAAEQAPLKEPEKMYHMIHDALENGHKIAITSFTRYPDAIPPVLARLGLTPEEIAQITIVVGYPQYGPDSPQGKQEHMELAAQVIARESHVDIKKQDTILVDDSNRNIMLSEQQGYAKGLVVNQENNETDFNQVARFTSRPALEPRPMLGRLSELLEVNPAMSDPPSYMPTTTSPKAVTHGLKSYQAAQQPLTKTAEKTPEPAPTAATPDGTAPPKTKPQ